MEVLFLSKSIKVKYSIVITSFTAGTGVLVNYSHCFTLALFTSIPQSQTVLIPHWKSKAIFSSSERINSTRLAVYISTKFYCLQQQKVAE